MNYKKEYLKLEKRTYNRFEIKKQSVEVELILEDYKRISGISLIENISLGGMKVLIKENINSGTDIKFHIQNNKQVIFHATVVWCKETDLQDFKFHAGISFNFPYQEDAGKQKKLLVEFVLKFLAKMTKQQLIDRLMLLFIERRKIFDAAKSHIDKTNKDLEKIQKKSHAVFEKAHNLIDYSLNGIIYFNSDYQVCYSNEAAEKITGYSSSEIKELSIQSLLNESSIKMLKRYFKKHNLNVFSGKIIHKNGASISIKWRVLPQNLDKKELLCFMFIQSCMDK